MDLKPFFSWKQNEKKYWIIFQKNEFSHTKYKNNYKLETL